MMSLAAMPVSAIRPSARASPKPRPFSASSKPLRRIVMNASNKDEPEKTEAERKASETAADVEARDPDSPRPRSERTGDRNNPGWDEVKGVGQDKYAEGERGNVRKKGVDAARERAAELDDWTNN